MSLRVSHSPCWCTQEKDSAIQKRGYKILAYICEEHKDFAKAHAQEVCANITPPPFIIIKPRQDYLSGILDVCLLL